MELIHQHSPLLTSKAARNAQIELQRRKDARINLIDFTRFTKPDYKPAALHRDIAEKLEAVERGEIKRLMIQCPPRHGKTELASRRFPAWFMAKHPELDLISASYGSELATDFGRDVRNIVDSPEYRCLFPKTKLAADSQAKDRWNISSGGAYIAAGVGTSITGRGANLFIIDDPIKDRATAESETYRNGVWDWYRAVAYTRLQPDAAIVLIQTRWHPDDLAGRLLIAEAEGTGDKWEKLILPAINEHGEALWPEAYNAESLKQIRAVIGEMDWASLYEQKPRPEGGSFFSENSLLMKDDATGNYLPLDNPKRYHTVLAVVDTAAKTGKTNDGVGVVFVAWSPAFDPPLAILDWDLKQIEGALLIEWLPTVFQRLEELAQETEVLLGSTGVWIEDKSSGIVLLQQADKLSQNVHAIDTKLTAMGKQERAINISSYVHAGRVKLTKRAYERTVTYKGRTRNHLLAQILDFRAGGKDMGEDDLLDCFSYSVALTLGNPEGF